MLAGEDGNVLLALQDARDATSCTPKQQGTSSSSVPDRTKHW
jgi:hypothetical protein